MTSSKDMIALLTEAFSPSVDLDTFMMTYVPKLHAARIEDFVKTSETTIVVSFLAKDTGQRYTVELRPDGCDVERGEMIDFPVATVIGKEADWSVLQQDILEVATALELHRETLSKKYVRRPLDESIREAFEAIVGQIGVTIVGGVQPIEVLLVLNDYESEQGAKQFSFQVDKSVVMELAGGKVDAPEVAKSLTIKGSMGLAFELAGFASKHLGA